MEVDIKYMHSNHMHSTKFMRNSKAVGVLWGIFSVCYGIIVIVVFTQVIVYSIEREKRLKSQVVSLIPCQKCYNMSQ